MNQILVLPAGPLADASLAIARASVSRSILDHSIRSFLFARLLADHAGCLHDAGYDEDLLFAATVMHDLGLGEHATGEARFEVEGADLAAAVLSQHGVAELDIDRVWEAIALHSSVGIADRRGLLTSLTHTGVFIDAGRISDAVADRLRQEVLTAYPRPAGDRSIADAIVAHATRSQAAAPPGSLAFELLRQHREAQRARNRPEGRQLSWPDESVAHNLERMDELDFAGWNRADWEGVFARYHTEDVLVAVHGQAPTHGLGEHIQAMKALVESTGDAPVPVTSHPIRFGSGDWTCVVGELEDGSRMVTLAKWRDGAIAEEYIWI
jgi:HD domain-containing protein